MSAKDNGWTITPTLAWFIVILVAGVCLFDGNINALADRLTKKREPQAAGARSRDRRRSPTRRSARKKMPSSSRNCRPLPPAATTSPRSMMSASTAPTTTCKRWAMDGFYKRARRFEGKGTLGRALRVSWYGDSVVATDALPGRLRTRLQGRARRRRTRLRVRRSPPHRFCAHEGITRSGGDNWLTYAMSMHARRRRVLRSGRRDASRRAAAARRSSSSPAR